MHTPTILVTMPTDGFVTKANCVAWVWYSSTGPQGVYVIEYRTPWPITGGTP